jgi:hypothetical protein
VTTTVVTLAEAVAVVRTTVVRLAEAVSDSNSDDRVVL